MSYAVLILRRAQKELAQLPAGSVMSTADHFTHFAESGLFLLL